MLYLIIATYLACNVVANLVVAEYGQAALVWTAFILIPFDLASRDFLHEKWSKKNNLISKMFLLIVTASVLTYATNASAVNVAMASTIAFICAATVDTIVYHLLKSCRTIVKMNASNICSATIDSIIFPLIAFQAINLTLSASQTALKIAGGLLWSLLLARILRKDQ